MTTPWNLDFFYNWRSGISESTLFYIFLSSSWKNLASINAAWDICKILCKTKESLSCDSLWCTPEFWMHELQEKEICLPVESSMVRRVVWKLFIILLQLIIPSVLVVSYWANSQGPSPACFSLLELLTFFTFRNFGLDKATKKEISILWCYLCALNPKLTPGKQRETCSLSMLLYVRVCCALPTMHVSAQTVKRPSRPMENIFHEVGKVTASR